jgi:hypothetical protein
LANTDIKKITIVDVPAKTGNEEWITITADENDVSDVH